MRSNQYRQILKNHARRAVGVLFPRDGEADALRSVVKAARRRERAAKTFAQLLPSEWRAVTEVEALEHGTLRVTVASPEIREQLRREAGRLARCVPGVRRVCVT